MTAPRQTFWMICRQPNGPQSRTEPKARFSHIDAARAKARQLAYDSNAPFVIMEAVEVIQPKDELTGSLF